MRTQQEYYEEFKALHEGPSTFIIANAWDGGSAVLAKAAGFKAVATSSAALAFTLGKLDGTRAVTREQHIDHGKLLISLTNLPLQGDTEDGFGPSPEDPALTVDAAIAAGFAGLSIEDTTANKDKPIHDFEDAVVRVKNAARRAKGKILLTARTDNFLKGVNDLDDTVRRLVAFAEAGADVLFAPYPPDMDAIRTIVRAVSPKPVSVLMGSMKETNTLQELEQAGVKRISLGASPYTHALAALADGYKAAAAGKLAVIDEGYAYGDLYELVASASEK
jgi:2-methylisocitrate lyase-like PEP mutase family enzyme